MLVTQCFSERIIIIRTNNETVFTYEDVFINKNLIII